MLDVEFLVDSFIFFLPSALWMYHPSVTALQDFWWDIHWESYWGSLIHVKLLFSCSCQESLFVFGSDSLVVMCLGLVSWLMLLGLQWRFLDLYIHVSSNLRGFQPLILQIISPPLFFLLFGISAMTIFVCLLMCLSLRFYSLFPILCLFLFYRLNNLKWLVFKLSHSFFFLLEFAVEFIWWIFLFGYCIFQLQKSCLVFLYFLSLYWYFHFADMASSWFFCPCFL